MLAIRAMCIGALFRIANAVALLFLLGVSARSVEPDLIESIHQETAALAESVRKKRQTVADALTAASKGKLLAKSTEALHRSVLAKLSAVEDPTDPEPTDFPPPLKTSEKLEPLNMAWRELRDEMRREFVRSSELSQQLREATGAALQAAAREGTRGADLDEADRLIKARRYNVSPRRPSSYFGSSLRAVQQVSSSMRAVLDAAQRKDVAVLEQAFARFRASEAYLQLPSLLMPVHPRLLVDELRARINAPYLAEAQAAQRKVESALLRDAPSDEVARAIVEFDAAYSTAERLSGKDRPRISAAYNDQATPVAVYRAAMVFKEWLREQDASTEAPSFPTVPPEGTSWVSAEFHIHMVKLRAGAPKHRQFLARRAEEKRVLAEREKQLEAENRKRAAIEAVRAQLQPMFEAIRTPQQVILLADAVEAAQSGVEGLRWAGLSGELRAIARWWLSRDTETDVPRQALPGDTNDHPFVLEMHAIRSRATRAAAIRQLKLPQLALGDFAEMDAFEALQIISDDAANRGEWRKTHDILRFLSAWDGGLAATRRERAEVIRAFLAARNLEDAGQPEQAACGYLSVIQAVGDRVPVKEAGERLKKLQAEHPELKAAMSEPPPSIEGVESVQFPLR
jgi:hypothetical protein